MVRISPLGTDSTARSAISDQSLHLVEDRSCNLLFWCFRNRALSGCREEGHLVVGGVEADVRTRDVVEDEEVGALARQLLAGTLEAGVARLGCEANQELTLSTSFAQRREHVARRL